jgi:hypothetical protein
VREDALQYAWQTLQFPLQALVTTSGQRLRIQHPGRLNTHQGPDFWDARVQLDALQWWGAVEVHVHTAGWYQHGHHTDPRYNSTILHVVAHSSGAPVHRADGSTVPELALGPLLSPALCAKLEHMHNQTQALPCAHGIATVPALVREGWLTRMGWARISDKAEALLPLLETYKGDWEQLLWVQLCTALGAPNNSQPFGRLANVLPIAVVRRYLADAQQLEALLLGAAGMLAQPVDAYTESLAQEWQYLQQKHSLHPMDATQFHQHRMRPANFPGLRLAQLATLLHKLPHLFALVEQPALLRAPVQAAPYWDTHYVPGKPGAPRPKRLGKQALDHLVINALVPFAACYLGQTGRGPERETLEDWLRALPAEDNTITRQFTSLGVPNDDAFASQAWLQLHKTYCSQRRCTECAIGHHLLHTPTAS